MKLNKVKKSLTLMALAVSISIGAQKQRKKFTEKFDVNKDVKIEIEASNAEIDVTTWNKNEVLVEAILEIEGLTKQEAEKYFKNYKFEALGNKSKVKITSRGGNSFRFSDHDFVIFNSDFVMPNITIPNIDIDIPEIDFDFKNIKIPEISIGNLFLELEDIEFDFDKYHKEGKDYFFKWKNGAKEIKIKSKKDWEKFKKSDEYKKWRDEIKKAGEEMDKELTKAMKSFKEIDLSAMNKELAKAMKSIKEIDMSEINKELAKVSKELKNLNFNHLFDADSNEFTINDKKVKIKKKITIKVPKGATFDLNTRHSKVKLPKGKTSGKVSYGSFHTEGLTGGVLTVSNSPVKVNSLNNSTLSLKNVTDASIASVANSKITSSSGNLTIDKIFSDVAIDLSFGDISILDFDPSMQKFTMNLEQSDGTIYVTNLKNISIYNASYVTTNKKNKTITLNKEFRFEIIDNTIRIDGKYSKLLIKN